MALTERLERGFRGTAEHLSKICAFKDFSDYRGHRANLGKLTSMTSVELLSVSAENCKAKALHRHFKLLLNLFSNW